jgi:hypothetical protein
MDKLNRALLRVGAQIAWYFLSNKNNRTVICEWFHNMFVLILQATLKLLNTNFPADSIVERETRGTLVKFLSSSMMAITINLDNTVTAQYQKLVDALDWLRKGVE